MSDRGQPPIGEAFDDGRFIVVACPGAGFGYKIPDDHNCDAMGCGAWHVLYRFRKPRESTTDAAPDATREKE